MTEHSFWAGLSLKGPGTKQAGIQQLGQYIGYV